jgi:AcrR family transcriptional regulator
VANTKTKGLPREVVAGRKRLVETGFIADSPSAAASDGTSARVLAEAVVLFADRGYDACTMRDLASAVGIKAPALYNHFSSKERILYAASRRALTQFLTDVVGPLDGEAPDDALRNVIYRYVDFQIRQRDLAQANDALLSSGTLDRCLPKDERDEIVDALRTFVDIITALVRAEGPPVDHRLAAFAITAMCDRVSAWYRPDGRLTGEQVAEGTWELVRSIVRGSAA